WSSDVCSSDLRRMRRGSAARRCSSGSRHRSASWRSCARALPRGRRTTASCPHATTPSRRSLPCRWSRCTRPPTCLAGTTWSSWGCPASSRTPEVHTRRCIARDFGRCGNSPASARPQRQSGVSVAFAFPSLMGYDSDHPRSLGEVGKCGVAISSLADMETLFDGIPLGDVSVSMTINGPAIIMFCFYVAAAEKQGVSPGQLRGTVQNDILKEYMAQHAWIYPAEPALKLIVDMFEWCSKHAPKYNPISISGYHIREAGSTAGQELAYTLRNGFEYVERGIERGLDVDDFAPRLSFFFDVHNDF